MKYLKKNGEKEEYWRRIENVAEKLHKDADELRNKGEHYKTIDWESFTIDYMKAGDWNTDLEHRLYKEKRSNMWKDDINAMFNTLGYSEWLFVEPTKGIRLEIDIIAARKMELLSLKKVCSISARRTRLLEHFCESFPPKLKKELLYVANLFQDQLTFIAGKIAIDKELPKNQKMELLEMIDNYSPED